MVALLVIPAVSSLLVDGQRQHAEAAVARISTEGSDSPRLPEASAAQRPGRSSPHAVLDALLRRPPPTSSAASMAEGQSHAAAHELCAAMRERVSCPYPGQRSGKELLLTQDRQWLCAQFCRRNSANAVESTRDGPFRAWYLRGGRVAVRGSYRADRSHGRWGFYHSNGRARLLGRFVAGHADGMWREWNEAGVALPPSRWHRGLRVE